MASEGTKRIRIAVAVAINGDWAAYGSSVCEGMTADEIDQANAFMAVRQLLDLGVKSGWRLNMVEAEVILPILEKQEVVVQAD